MKSRLALVLTVSVLLAACAQAPRPAAPSGHLGSKDVPAAIAANASAAPIPAPVDRSFSLPPPQPVAKAETYSVVVNEVDVRELSMLLEGVDLRTGRVHKRWEPPGRKTAAA